MIEKLSDILKPLSEVLVLKGFILLYTRKKFINITYST